MQMTLTKNEVTLLAATIPSACGAAGFLFKKYLEDRSLLRVSSDPRLSAVAGHWSGKIDQPSHVWGPLCLEFAMDLQTKRKVVLGSATLKGNLHFPGEDTARAVVLKLTMNGGFYERRFIKLDYSNAEPGVLQFGAILFEVDPLTTSMSGQIIGYGPYSKSLVYGSIEVRKEI